MEESVWQPKADTSYGNAKKDLEALTTEELDRILRDITPLENKKLKDIGLLLIIGAVSFCGIMADVYIQRKYNISLGYLISSASMLALITGVSVYKAVKETLNDEYITRVSACKNILTERGINY